MCDNFELDTRFDVYRVIQAVPGCNYNVYLYFENGQVREFSARKLIFNEDGTVKNGVFAPLADRNVFRDKLTVIDGSPAWDIEGNRDAFKMLDFPPCELSENLDEDYPLVPDPFESDNWKSLVLTA
jgi:hypothetical protein